MATSDQLLRDYMEALAAEGLDVGDLEAELIGRIGRMRIKRDNLIRDMEVAKLLPQGAEAVMQRFGGCRATAYNRAHRYLKLSKSREAG